MSAPTYELRLTEDQIDTLLRGLMFAEDQMLAVTTAGGADKHTAFAGATVSNALHRLRTVIETATQMKVPEGLANA